MQNGKISVVVPIYKIEKYLDRCLESLVKQSYNNLEIILIDDGSPDRCPEICDRWAENDKRIKAVHKENMGLGMARNTGIEHATGEYICFVDGDDFLESDTIEKAYIQAVKTEADVVYFGYKDVDTSGKIIKEYKPELSKLVYRNDEVTEELLPELISPDYSKDKKSNLMLSACMALFSSDLIYKFKWRFVSEREIISEDMYSLMILFSHVKCAAVVPEALYCYCRNELSLTRRYRKDRYNGIKHFYDEIMKLCDEYKYPEVVKVRFSSVYLAFVIAALKTIIMSDKSLFYKLDEMNQILMDPHLKNTLQKAGTEIENKRRKLMLSVLIKQKTLECYCLLFIKYKIKWQR